NTDSWLRTKNTLRGPQETTLFDYRHEHFKLHEFHIAFSRPSTSPLKRTGPSSTSDNGPWHSINYFSPWSLSGLGVHANSFNRDYSYSVDSIKVRSQKRETPKQTLNRIVGHEEDEPGLTIFLHLAYQIPRHIEVNPISNIYLGRPKPFWPHVNSPQLLQSPLSSRAALSSLITAFQVLLCPFLPSATPAAPAE